MQANDEAAASMEQPAARHDTATFREPEASLPPYCLPAPRRPHRFYLFAAFFLAVFVLVAFFLATFLMTFLATIFFGGIFFVVFFLVVFIAVFFDAVFRLVDFSLLGFLADLFCASLLGSGLLAGFGAGLLGVLLRCGWVPEDEVSPADAAESQKRNSGAFSSAPFM
jgi:hypothetical protein